MFKRIVILVLISTILIMSSSCSSPTAYDIWKEMCDQYPDQKGKVRIVSDNDEGDYHIKYDGVDYYVEYPNSHSVIVDSYLTTYNF